MSTATHALTPAMPLPRHLVLAKWLGYFMLVDLLFLPYFQALIMPFSLPLVLCALFVTRMRLVRDRYLTLLFFIAFAVFASAVLSQFDSRLTDFHAENFKRAVQLLSSFAYFFYFRWLSRQIDLRTERVAVCFTIWFGLLATAFFFDPAGTGETIRAFYGRLVTSEETLALHLRFSYQFTDPNTAAYFFLIAVSPLLMAGRTGLQFTLIVAVIVILTFVTQSKGALLALMLVVMLTLYPPARFMETALSVKRIALLFAILVAGYFAYVWLSDTFEANPLLKLAYERIFESSDQIASGGSRFGTWQRFLENFTPLPLGRGFILMIGGIADRPHSDLIRILFSYGFVALIPALIFFFGRFFSWPALILPALMAFLINSLIDEQKLLALFLSLLAIQVGREDRRRNSNLEGNHAR